MLEPHQPQPPPEYAMMPSGPFSRLTGPHYFLACEGVYAMLVHMEDRHFDRTGAVHGGMLVNISDNANTGAAELLTGGTAVVTVSLNCDYTGKVGRGWLLAEARVSRQSGSMIFTACEIRSRGGLIMSSSAICKIQGVR